MNFFTRIKQAFKVFLDPDKFVDKADFIEELKQSVKNPEYLPEVLRASVDYAQTTCGFIDNPLPYAIESDQVENDQEFFTLCIYTSRIIEEFLKSVEHQGLPTIELATPEKLNEFYATKEAQVSK
jgi:hypothetical protein